MASKNEIAVFGGGCFWCTEAIFQELKGVVSVMPGYSGGTLPNPSYEQVCSGKTGHAEVTKIEFDPTQISFRDLLLVFFATHDPTTPNRQGADVGTQYRSIVLYSNHDQKDETGRFIKELEESEPGGKPVVTEIKPLTEFYPAEDYHKQYYLKNKNQPYCQLIIEPKVEKLQEKFANLLKTKSK